MRVASVKLKLEIDREPIRVGLADDRFVAAQRIAPSLVDQRARPARSPCSRDDIQKSRTTALQAVGHDFQWPGEPGDTGLRPAKFRLTFLAVVSGDNRM